MKTNKKQTSKIFNYYVTAGTSKKDKITFLNFSRTAKGKVRVKYDQ